MAKAKTASGIFTTYEELEALCKKFYELKMSKKALLIFASRIGSETDWDIEIHTRRHFRTRKRDGVLDCLGGVAKKLKVVKE